MNVFQMIFDQFPLRGNMGIKDGRKKWYFNLSNFIKFGIVYVNNFEYLINKFLKYFLYWRRDGKGSR